MSVKIVVIKMTESGVITDIWKKLKKEPMMKSGGSPYTLFYLEDDAKISITGDVIIINMNDMLGADVANMYNKYLEYHLATDLVPYAEFVREANSKHE